MHGLLSTGLLIAVLLFSASESRVQDNAGLFELHGEAIAGGITLTLPAESTWSVGIDLSLGNHFGVNLLEVDDEVDLIGAGYGVVTWRPDNRVQVSLGPIGLATVLGNDFAAIYPSARLGLGYFPGKFGVGTELRLVRIAGGNGTGNYWLHWSPVRVSLRL